MIELIMIGQSRKVSIPDIWQVPKLSYWVLYTSNPAAFTWSIPTAETLGKGVKFFQS